MWEGGAQIAGVTVTGDTFSPGGKPRTDTAMLTGDLINRPGHVNASWHMKKGFWNKNKIPWVSNQVRSREQCCRRINFLFRRCPAFPWHGDCVQTEALAGDCREQAMALWPESRSNFAVRLVTLCRWVLTRRGRLDTLLFALFCMNKDCAVDLLICSESLNQSFGFLLTAQICTSAVAATLLMQTFGLDLLQQWHQPSPAKLARAHNVELVAKCGKKLKTSQFSLQCTLHRTSLLFSLGSWKVSI